MLQRSYLLPRKTFPKAPRLMGFRISKSSMVGARDVLLVERQDPSVRAFPSQLAASSNHENLSQPPLLGRSFSGGIRLIIAGLKRT